MDENTILAPLEFLLPKREVVVPVEDLSADLSSPTSSETVTLQEPTEKPHPVADPVSDPGSTEEPHPGAAPVADPGPTGADPVKDPGSLGELKHLEPATEDSDKDFYDPELEAILNDPGPGGPDDDTATNDEEISFE